MKRFIAVAAVCLAAVGLYAAVAPAGQQSVTPRQFAALSKKVTKLQKDFNSLKSIVATCTLNQAVPVAQFGNPAGNEGYAYQNPDNSLELQTALDVSVSTAAQGWFLSTTTDCANAINSGKGKKVLAGLRAHVK
jgi:hypothetical protein